MDARTQIPPQIELTEEMRQEIRGACAEVDPEQMAIIARMTPAERFTRGVALSESVLQVAIYLLQKAEPGLTSLEARRRVLRDYYQRNPSTHPSQR
jgi:hypothetical protein